jgi:F-type H+-transporting ATPase subunit epsilon
MNGVQEMVLRILSPNNSMGEFQARSVMVPGVLGCLTVLPGHAALVSELGIGSVLVDGPQRGNFFIAGGYLEVQDNQLLILADIIEPSDKIDAVRAEQARTRAVERLSASSGAHNQERALKALQRAEARLNLVRGSKAAKH